MSKEMDEELEVQVVSLTDQEGNEVEFELLDVIEYEGERYVFLLGLEENSDEIQILQAQPSFDPEDEEEFYVGVEDEELLSAVYAIFKEQHQGEFNFAD